MNNDLEIKKKDILLLLRTRKMNHEDHREMLATYKLCLNLLRLLVHLIKIMSFYAIYVYFILHFLFILLVVLFSKR